MDVYKTMSFCPLVFQGLFTLSQFPEAFRFSSALQNIQYIQESILLNYLRKNQETRFGKEHGFSRIRNLEAYRKQLPIRTYQEFLAYIEEIQHGKTHILTSEDVLYFLPTGGTSGTKLIPYTASLKREFQRALAPWLVDIAKHFPAILTGKTYWTITPPGHRLRTLQAREVPIGFEEDSAYFGWKGQLLGNIFAMPSWITQLQSIKNFRFLSLYFLLKERNLRWISIWSPTFFLVLLDELEKQADALLISMYDGFLQLPEHEKLPVQLSKMPIKKRAKTLEKLFALPAKERYRKIWPHLSFISLWKDAYARYPAKKLEQLFPNAYFQGKGLLATEGVMTIPLHNARGCVPAFTSHFFEFSSEDQEARCLWELEEGKTYSVLLTTGGGLYRYDIGDLVTVTGFYHNGSAKLALPTLPILRFIGRKGRFSDLSGEKLEERFVNDALENVLEFSSVDFSFFLLAPEEWEKTRGYVIFIESAQEEKALLNFTEQIEAYFKKNVHYDFAVKMGQISALQVFLISKDGQKEYLKRCIEDGQKLGDIKPLLFDVRTGWKEVFQGRFLCLS